MEQAGAFIAHSGGLLDFGSYLKELRPQGLRVFAGGRVDDYDHVVSTVWDHSFDEVPTDTLSGGGPRGAGGAGPRPPATGHTARLRGGGR